MQLHFAFVTVILLGGCLPLSDLQLALIAAEPVNDGFEYPTDFCEFRFATTSITQEFDREGRLVRRLQGNVDTMLTHQELEGGGSEKVAVTNSVEAGTRSRTVSRTDSAGRTVFESTDQGDDGEVDELRRTDYDENGETIIYSRNGNTTTTTVTRDEFGNVVFQVSEFDGVRSGEVRWTYTEDGQRPLSHVVANEETRWTYNSLGFEESMTVEVDGATTHHRLWEFGEDGTPQSVYEEKHGIVVRDTLVVYEGTNLVFEEGLRSSYEGSVQATWEFSYDRENRLIERRVTADGETHLIVWTRGDDGRFLSIQHSSSESDEAVYEFDAEGRILLIGNGSGEYDATWSYDCL